MVKHTDQTDTDISQRISRLPPEICNQILEEGIPPRALKIDIHWKLSPSSRLREQMALREPYQPALMGAFFKRDGTLHSR